MLSICHIHKALDLSSTIFKTVQDLTTGKTKITSSGFFSDMFKGDFFKPQSIVSKEDISALENYNNLLKDNKPTEAFDKAMKNASTTAQNLAKSAKGAAVNIDAIPKVSKAAVAGLKLLSGVMNIVSTMLITYLISGIYKMAGAYEEMSQQAADATAKYKEQSSSLEDYKGKITELKAELSSENLTYADARDKRSQLLDIQKQLIDTYGAEAKGIDLVNSSLDDQVEKLDKLNKQKRQEWENEVNKQSTGQWWQKWGGYLGLALLDTVTFDWSFYDANKWLEDFDNTTNIERITEKVENFKKSISLNDLEIDTEELEALKTQMESYEGVSFKGNKMTIAGDAKTVAETVTKIQTEVIGSREDLQSLNQDLKDVYNSANKIVTENWDTYNQALENKILDDDKGFEYYGKLTDAYEVYQDALKDGDEDAINRAKEDYASLLNDINNSDMDDSFKKFFENMYPDISQIVESWKFEVKIVPKIVANEGGLKDSIDAVNGLTTDEIKAAFENNGAGVSKDQWKAITDLNAEAQLNGLDLSTFLEQLREAGYLVSNLDKNIEKTINDTKTKYGDGVDWDKYFKDNSIDTEEELDIWNEVTDGIDNAEEAMKSYADATREAVDISQELKTFNEEVDEIQDAYSTLKDAVDEYNTTGYMSLDTVQKLLSLEPQYLAMLVNENGQLSLNEQAMRDLLTARLEETKAKIYESGINQINALTSQKTGEASKEAAGKKSDAVSDIEDETRALNENTEAGLKNAASKAVEAGASKEEVEAIVGTTIATAKALESGINGLKLDFSGTVSGKKSGSSGGSGSDKNEALDNYLKYAESIYKVHQDEEKYINDLQWSLNNLTKTDEERLEIAEKIKEAYRDLADNSIKDIEHQNELLLNQGKTEYDLIKNYKKLQNIASEEANRYRAEMREDLLAMGYTDEDEISSIIENSDYIQELQKTWWDNRSKEVDAKFANSQDWINERNTYNGWELFGDSEVDAWERVLKWLKEEYPEAVDEIKEAEENVFNARKDAMEKSIDDIQDYIDARNTYNDWDAYGDSEVKAIQRQTKIIEDAYKQRLLSYEEYVDRLEEQSQRIYSLAQDEINKNLSNIDKYIDARNHYNDWDEFGDSEIDAIKRQIKYLDAAYKQKLISYEDYTERVAEYTQKMYSVAKDNIVEEVSKLIEDYEEMKSLETSQLESQKTLLQSYYDVTNAVAEAQHEINKELKASQSMYEYLNEETRELLFNQEDYNVLNEELLEIQSAADALQKQYQEDILNANAETIAEITSQYQMQYATMMKQYEIAKAELDIAKKRQQLDNVLAERNTRMFINGQWQWVAKTQDVINAQNELAEAEIERKKQEASLEQTEAINTLTLQINGIETDLAQVRKYWSDMQEMLNGESNEVAEALRQLSEVSSPELKRVIEATGGSVSSFSASLSTNTKTMSEVITNNLDGVSYSVSGFISNLKTYSDAIISLAAKINSAKSSSASSTSTSDIKAQMAANSAAWHTASASEKKKLEQANQVLGASIGSTYNPGTGTWTHKYAKGTRYTSNGKALMGEEGFEAFISNSGHLIPINQPTIGNIGAGGIVFNREQMADLRTLWDWSNIGKISPFVSSSNANSQSTVVDNSIHINGLTVSEQGNEDWINGLRRYVATHK